MSLDLDMDQVERFARLRNEMTNIVVQTIQAQIKPIFPRSSNTNATGLLLELTSEELDNDELGVDFL